MPHYSDGTEAKAGDVVAGKTYNIGYPITGVVVGITPGADTCNCRIATAVDTGAAYGSQIPVAGILIDHGEVKAFRLLSRAGVVVSDGVVVPA